MPVMELQRIFEAIENSRDEIISFQRDLTSKVALGPDNGGTGEHAKAAYLRERLEELKPMHLEEIKAPDDRAEGGYRPNIVAQWQGRKEAPTVWVLSHMDIVPPGDLSLWQSDPYEVRVDGDKIIGRGVEDNQHGIVSSYLPLKAMKDLGWSPVRPVGLVLVADEETGSRYGLEYVLTHHRDLFKPEDLIIVPDGGNEEGTMIEVAEKSMLWLKITVTGKQCHGSTPSKGKNSLHGAARLIVDLEAIKTAFGEQDALFSPPESTFEPTKMEPNVPNVNTIPGKNVFYMDCRILPHYAIEDVIQFARERALKVANAWGLTIDVEAAYQQVAPDPTPVDAPVVQALTKAIRAVKGVEAKPMGIGGGTVAAFFRRAGLPAAVWLTEPDTPHQPNEFCLISNLVTDAKVFASIYMDA
jgi:succinyl-diaminopimelate desuccinylase